MPNRRNIQARILVILFACIALVITACSVGPFEISIRQAPNANNIGLTVTAALATNTQIAALRTSTAVASIAPIIQPTQPPASQGDVLLVYTGDALTLYNNTNRAIDVAGLSFHSDRGELPANTWDNGFLSASLFAFPPGDCLMVWPVDIPQQLKPGDCETRHSWLAVNSLQTFWLTDSVFYVRWYGQLITTCPGGINTCYIDLP